MRVKEKGVLGSTHTETVPTSLSTAASCLQIACSRPPPLRSSQAPAQAHEEMEDEEHVVCCITHLLQVCAVVRVRHGLGYRGMHFPASHTWLRWYSISSFQPVSCFPGPATNHLTLTLILIGCRVWREKVSGGCCINSWRMTMPRCL